MSLFYVDHDTSLPATPSAPRPMRWGQPLDCRFLPLSLVACQHIDNFPGLCVPSGPTDGLRSLTPYAPGVGAPDHRFLLLPLSPPLFTRRPRIAYGSSNVHDANGPTPACGIDGFYKFSIFPLATPTRTSSVSFEPLLPLLTCLFHRPSSSFSADAPLPRVSSGLFRTALAQWYSVGGSFDLLS